MVGRNERPGRRPAPAAQAAGVRIGSAPRGEAAACLAVALILAALTAGSYRPHTWLRGDGPYYAAVTLSLVQDGDFDLRNQLLQGLESHSKQLALGTGGEWYPKHPVLLPLLTVPFALLFGLNGTLICNVTLLVLLFAAMVRLARGFLPPAAALAAALLITFTTFLPAYSYYYSPDLLAALLVVGGLAACFRDRDVLAGLLLGGAVWVRVTNGLFLGAALAAVGFRRPRRAAAMRLLGALVPLAVMAGLHSWMFGAPWITGYDRTMIVEDGAIYLVSHRDFFDYPLWRGIGEQLFDPRQGLLITCPVLWLALPGGVRFFRKRPAAAALLGSSCLAVFLLFSKYRFWRLGHEGNRFLMPLVCLSVVPLGYLFEYLGSLRRREKTETWIMQETP